MRVLQVLMVVVVVCGIGCSPDEPLPPTVPLNDALLVRGKELVEGVGACGFCHSLQGTPQTPLSGGRLLQDSLGEVRAPNITVAATGIGTWQAADLQRVFRFDMDPSDEPISTAFHGGFEWMSDADIAAIMGYLRAMPPVEHKVEERDTSFFTRNTTGFFQGKRQVRGYIPQVLPTFKVQYGQYLADHVARCASCHNGHGGILSSEEYLGGGKEIVIDGETKVAPNITTSKVSGIGEWSESDLTSFFATGSVRDGTRVDPRFCPVGFYSQANPQDIEALVAYLRTVAAVE